MAEEKKSLRNRLSGALYNITAKTALHRTIRSMGRPNQEVDPAIRYPSYKSMDEFLDLERLQSLDGILRAQVEENLAEGRALVFDTGDLRFKPLSKREPGSKVFHLTTPKRKDVFRYHDLTHPELWERTELVERFPEFMDFVETMPFEEVGRIIIMCDDGGHQVSEHRDHFAYDVLHEFIWFRTNLAKPFFTMDWKTKEKAYVASHSAWFDTVNQYHGADAIEGLSISMRVDGRFTDELRAQIPVPPKNAASTPSYWACLSS